MNELVQVHHLEPMTTSEVIAEGVEMEHKSVIQLIRKYVGELQNFGEVAFEMRLNAQGSPTEFAWLNEQQSTFLITLMRNTPRVVDFKIALVKAFFALRDQLRSAQSAPPVLSRDPSHVADLTVAASRTFNALLRTSRAAGLSLPKALRQANAGTIRKTGVDMLKEIEAEAHVADLEAAQNAPLHAAHERPEDPLEIAVRQWAQNVEPDTYYRMEQIIEEAIGMKPKDRRWSSMAVFVARILKRIGFSCRHRRIDARVYRYWERLA